MTSKTVKATNKKKPGLVGKGRLTRADWEAIIGFALETAMRTQEIVFAEWSHLFDDDRKLRIPKKNSKTKTARIVLMSLAARKILKSQRERCPQGQKRIFFQLTSPDALTEAFIRLTKRVGIEDLHFHDLRHEAVTRLCASGKLKQMEIMAMTGHKSSVTFQRYAHLITAENDTYLD
jgi:integrase